MSDLEKKFEQMLSEIETSNDKLRAINSQLRLFYDRLEDKVKQHRRKMPVRDVTFEEEFRALVLDLRKLTDNSQDFWQETRAYFRILDKNKMVLENRVYVKRVNIAALAFTRQTDELFTVFKNLQELGKDISLRLNWWLLESSSDDLFKITNKILFLTRDMEKRYE